MLEEATILIIEDGDEYLDNLTRFVAGPRYIQAHNGAEALRVLESEPVGLIYLDMRFDRIPKDDLLGDHNALTLEHNGDPERAWRYLQNNQGLYILDHISQKGYSDIPVILAYDFSGEHRRYEFLQKTYRKLSWVPDAVTGDEIRTLMLRLLPEYESGKKIPQKDF